jgi:hypothetical protein
VYISLRERDDSPDSSLLTIEMPIFPFGQSELFHLLLKIFELNTGYDEPGTYIRKHKTSTHHTYVLVADNKQKSIICN